MSKSKLEYALKEWGQWTERHLEWHNEIGENILYRAGFMTGTHGRPGHKILCPPCPLSVRRTDRAIRNLSGTDSDTLFFWYASPTNSKTGKPFTIRQLANELGMSAEAFKKRLYRSRKNLRAELRSRGK